jgi:cellulose synthase/poly-beta-1,6-N-acetylglucosamine synthase-like glycosyltransferase
MTTYSGVVLSKRVSTRSVRRCVQRVAPDAVVIGLIDSDYQTKPTFLAASIDYFDDPRIGFVQSPHDYGDWQHSLYQRMCYWEYRSFFTICVASWNERCRDHGGHDVFDST